VIGHQHAGDIQRVLERRGLEERIVRGGLAQFHRLLVLGERWRAMFERYGIAMPCEICPSTFRREVFERGLTAVRTPPAEGALRVLFVGQIGERKGVHDLLRALRRLKDAGVRVSATFAGPAQLEGEMEAAERVRRELSAEHFTRFCGPLTGEALYREFETHDVFALPSYNEGLPAVLYEAGAFALALVTTPVGAIPELVRTGENGLLVEPGDVAGLTRALAALTSDRDLRARLGAKLRQDVEAYLPDRIAARVATAVRAEWALR
jgi:glycosyltransferase involved in cell wall biosynthesis